MAEKIPANNEKYGRAKGRYWSLLKFLSGLDRVREFDVYGPTMLPSLRFLIMGNSASGFTHFYPA
jgi:hypothetical protein